MVAATKKTIHHLLKQPRGRDFNYAEAVCLYAKASEIINRRPLGVRHHGKSTTGEICVITPAMLVQGGRVCSGHHHEQELCQTMAPHARMALVEENFKNWWKQWYSQVWESLIPIKKWRTEKRNPRVGDIVLLKYDQKFSKPGYRYGKVVKTMEDEASLVRDVVVATRSRRIKEKEDEYKPAPMDHQLVPIQRTVLLLPAEDLASLPEPRELHLCEESTEVPGLGPGDAPPRPPVSHSSSSQCASTSPSSTTSQRDPGSASQEAEVSESASQEAEVSGSASQEAEDSEVASLSHFINQVVTNTTVDLMEPFLCSDCGVREVVMYSGTF